MVADLEAESSGIVRNGLNKVFSLFIFRAVGALRDARDEFKKTLI